MKNSRGLVNPRRTRRVPVAEALARRRPPITLSQHRRLSAVAPRGPTRLAGCSVLAPGLRGLDSGRPVCTIYL